jgi:hypothetical protein
MQGEHKAKNSFFVQMRINKNVVKIIAMGK